MAENSQSVDSACTVNENTQACYSSTEHKQKGLQYSKDISERKFKGAVSAWRCCVGRISILLIDETDIEVIRSGRNDLDNYLRDVKAFFDNLVKLNESDENEIKRISAIFETLEVDHTNFMCQISDRIRDIQAEIRSHASIHSSRGSARLSRGSRVSSILKRSNVIAEAAVLKTKLKFIDAESKAQAELEKIVTKKKLAIAEAQIDVFDTHGENDESNTFDSHCSQKCDIELPKQNYSDYTKNYVETHMPIWNQDIKPKVDNIKAEIADCKPQVDFTDVAPQVPVSFGLGSTFTLNPSANSFPFSVSQPVYSSQQNPHYSTVTSCSHTTREQMDQKAKESKSVPLVDTSPSRVIPSGEILELTKSLSEQLLINRLPPPEPGVFDGDPLNLPSWKSAFHTLIEQRGIAPVERIHYLRKYLSKSVQDVVSNFFLLSSDKAYDEAKLLLEKRYGDPFVIANAFRSKLEKWPKIQSKDSLGLRRFADFLKQCHAAMETIGSLSVLDDERENRKLLAKLPDWVVVRWNRIAVKSKEELCRFPSFVQFIEFLTKEANIACDPIASLQSFKVDEGYSQAFGFKSGLFDAKSGRGQSVRARALRSDVGLRATSQASSNLVCLYCKRNHTVEKCFGFLALPVEKRKSFVRETGLCFGCLKKGHTARKCFCKMKCVKCGKPHPTVFHEDKPPVSPKVYEPVDKSPVPSSFQEPLLSENKPVIAKPHLIQSGAGNNSIMILPVFLCHDSCPDNELLVYAMLDTQSDTTFVLEDVCASLGFQEL